MNIFRIIGELVVIYILYKFIFGFIIPLYNSSKQMSGKMKEMQQRMQEQQRAQAEQDKQFTQEKERQSAKVSSDDYIDYEEIKE